MAKISEGKWGLGISKHSRSNCLRASNSCQILEPEGASEFIKFILHLTGKGAEVKAQRVSPKARSKVRFLSAWSKSPYVIRRHIRQRRQSNGRPPGYTSVAPCLVPWDAVSAPGLLIGGCLPVGLWFIPEPTRNVLQASVEGFGLNVRKYILINDKTRSWRRFWVAPSGKFLGKLPFSSDLNLGARKVIWSIPLPPKSFPFTLHSLGTSKQRKVTSATGLLFRLSMDVPKEEHTIFFTLVTGMF